MVKTSQQTTQDLGVSSAPVSMTSRVRSQETSLWSFLKGFFLVFDVDSLKQELGEIGSSDLEDEDLIDEYVLYLDDLEIQREAYQRNLRILKNLHIAALIILLIVPVAGLLDEVNQASYEFRFSEFISNFSYIELAAIVILLTTILFGIYEFIDELLLGNHIDKVIEKLSAAESEYGKKRTRARQDDMLNPELRLKELHYQYQRELHYLGRTSFESDENKADSDRLRREIGKNLDELRHKLNENQSLDSELMNDINYSIGSLQRLRKDEAKAQKAQAGWQRNNVYVIVIYTVSILAVMLYTAIYNPALASAEVPFISIPLWALVWGALGSLAAILHRFYSTSKRVRASIERQWLIARPLTGILMSAVAYLAIVSGILFLEAEDSDTLASVNAERFAMLACFLAGFSDKFYLGIVELLTSKIGTQETNPVSAAGRDEDDETTN
ncbi:MAG: hypothetical protein ACFBSG_15755 [Leptolyngbyaceae cyanobacterium]